MLGLGLNLGLSASGSGLPTIAGYRPLFYFTPYRDEDKTFTRASTATYIAADDAIESAAVNVLRNRDHSNGAAAILMEGQSTNFVPYSEATTAQWSTSSVTATQLSGDYLGAFSGVRAASTGGTWNRLQASALSWTSGVEYSVSFWYVAGTSNRARLNIRDDSTSLESRANGVIGGLTVGLSNAGTITDVVETHLGGGVYKTTYIFTPADTTTQGRIGIGPDTTTVDGDIIALGAQFEEGAAPTSYIPTSGTVATRAIDNATIDASTLSLSGGFWVVLKGLQLDGVSGGFDRIMQLDSGSNSDRMLCAYSASTENLNIEQWSGDVRQAVSSEAYTLGGKVDLAYRFKEDDFATVLPSGTIVTDTSCTFTAPSAMYMAANGSAGGSKPARVSYEEISIYPPDITPEQMKSALGL